MRNRIPEMQDYTRRIKAIVPIYGVDPVTVITILVPIILEIIKQCQDRPSRIAKRLSQRDGLSLLTVRVAMRQYIRKVNGPRKMLDDLVDSTYTHCNSLGAKGLGQAIACMQQQGD